MKKTLPLLFFIICSFCINAQNEIWNKYFANNKAPIYLDNYNQSNLILLESPAYTDLDIAEFKIINTEGELLKQIDIHIEGYPFIKKTNTGYLLNFIDFGNENNKVRKFVSKLFDHDLNLLKDTSAVIDLEWCLTKYFSQCHTGSYQSFMELNDSTLFTVGVIGHRFDSTVLFSSTISKNGNIIDFKLDKVWSKYRYESGQHIKIMPNNDTSYYLHYFGNFELRDFDFNIIKKVDYTGIASNQIRGGYVPEIVQLKDSSFLMFTHNTYLIPFLPYVHFITLGTWTKDMKFNLQDTVNVFFDIMGDSHGIELTGGHNQIILETDEDDETFYSIIGYLNQLSVDTNAARILLLKYNKDLEILCTETYVVRDREIIVTGSVKNTDGNYYVSAFTGTKPFNYNDVNSEIILVEPDCRIPGMETLKEYLGEMSISHVSNNYGIHLLQNPVANELCFVSIEDPFPSDLTVKIYNFSGQLLQSSKVIPSANQLKLPVQHYITGLYIYQVLSGNKVIGNGKFLKK